jgi:hypothetical protein
MVNLLPAEQLEALLQIFKKPQAMLGVLRVSWTDGSSWEANLPFDADDFANTGKVAEVSQQQIQSQPPSGSPDALCYDDDRAAYSHGNCSSEGTARSLCPMRQRRLGRAFGRTPLRGEMFERYTQDARRVLFFARAKTGERNGDEIAPEDLLDGLLLAAPELVRRYTTSDNDVLRPAESAEAAINRWFHPGGSPDPRMTRETPFGHQVKDVLITAAEEADALGHREIEPVHLLLGLLHDENTDAWRRLSGCGISRGSIRDALQRGT